MIGKVPHSRMRWPVLSRPHIRPGFLVLDVLFGLTVLAIFVGFAGSSLLFGQQASVKSGDRMRAAFLSRQAVEAVRSIRDEDYNSVQEGTFGVRIGDDGKWELMSGASITTEDGYTTSVTISVPEQDRLRVRIREVVDAGIGE